MKKMKILIVDFDEESSLALSEYLKSEGFNVSTAGDGEAGLEKCKSEYPDLVIVEPMISKLHGFELCSIISHDFNGQIPVVILTKFYREEQFKIEAMSAYGASAFLSKPFKGPEILSSINDLLKEKIKEIEEKEMVEETQNLEDFSEESLDNIKVEEKITGAKLRGEDTEDEILELVRPLETNPEKEEKGPDIKTQIDKMLEDTLSEFGLNLGGKASLKTEEKFEGPAKEEAVEEKAAFVEKKHVEIKEVEVDKVETEEEVEVEANVDIPDQDADEKPKEAAIFSGMEEEGKTKISPGGALKSSIAYLKKLPLKFIIPLILFAAVALSASFIFRKPKSVDLTPKNMTAAIQPVKTSTEAESEEIAIEDPDEDQQSQDPSPEQESSTQPPAEESNDKVAEVKTKVNEVFPVEDPTAKAPDVESVDLEEDVLSATTESPAPLLPQDLSVSPLEDNKESTDTPSENSSNDPISLGNPDTTQEEGQPEEASQTGSEDPAVETGDLIPIEDVDIEPEIAKRVDPKYPSVAFQRGVEGKVVINVLISESGDVIETALIKGISGPYGFNEDCTDAVRQWKFVPAFKNGVKVKVWKTISFTFKKS